MLKSTPAAQLARQAHDIHATPPAITATLSRGTVRITAPTVFSDTWLTAQLPALRQRWPQVQLAITLSDHAVDLSQQGLDLGLAHHPARALASQHGGAGAQTRALHRSGFAALFAKSLGSELHHPGQLTEAGQRGQVQCIALGYGDFQNRLQWIARQPPRHGSHQSVSPGLNVNVIANDGDGGDGVALRASRSPAAPALPPWRCNTRALA